MEGPSLESMAERVSSRPVLASDAQALPPTAELVSVVSRCEERLSAIWAHVSIGNLPERSGRDMRETVDSRARSASAELRQALSEMDFILASVGLAGGDPWRESAGQKAENHANVPI